MGNQGYFNFSAIHEDLFSVVFKHAGTWYAKKLIVTNKLPQSEY